MDLDELLRAADPARDISPPDGHSAAAQLAYTQIVRPKGRRTLPRPRLRPVLALLMTIGLVVTAGELLFNHPHPTESPGAHELRQVAALVLDRPTSQPAPGQYLYTETKSEYQATIYQQNIESDSLVPVASAQYWETSQSWADINGNGNAHLTRSPLQFSSASDQSAWAATGLGQTFSAHFAPSVIEPSLDHLVPNVSSLSADPQDLVGQIASGFAGSNVEGIPNGPSAVFQRTSRLLLGPVSGMSAPLTSAFYQVLANQPDVTLLGPVKDHGGRQGVGVSISTRDGTSELIIDPRSGLALEAQYLPPASSLPPAEGSVSICPLSTTCPSSGSQLTPEGAAEVIAPVWTDTVASQIVGSEGATPASAALSSGHWKSHDLALPTRLLRDQRPTLSNAFRTQRGGGFLHF
ncbi:MAG: hypothetical protein ACREP9_12500 [Candidatus Dormibacteraceae bacterium]